MDGETRARVRGRAGGRCEYCRLPEGGLVGAHQVEHVIARQHGGDDGDDNLAMACARCNMHKGPNIAGLDEGRLVPLFHPRLDLWADHFAIRGATLVGLTPSGRATVQVLAMNSPGRVEVRELLIDLGLYG